MRVFTQKSENLVSKVIIVVCNVWSELILVNVEKDINLIVYRQSYEDDHDNDGLEVINSVENEQHGEIYYDDDKMKV